MTRKLAILMLLIASAIAVKAQDYRYEVGPAIGVTGYLGDVNTSNMYKMSRVAGGGMFRYNMNTRFAIKGNLFYVGLAGDSKNIESQFPHNESYKFSSHVIDLGAQFEFNFFHYGEGPKYKNYKRFTPYMLAG
ncbi:MAG: hypothetical protein IJ925_05675, partial [Muribaculaceae bacterium]|nr:hypothetical protein [Muribaculaceae bacterium]